MPSAWLPFGPWRPSDEQTYCGSSSTLGFTILEMVVTVAVVTILTGIVLPTIDLGRHRADSAVRELVTALAAAQNRAVLRQHDIVVAFDTAQGTVRIHSDSDNDGMVGSDEPLRLVEIGDGMRFGRMSAAARPFGERAVSFTQEQDDLPALTFHRNGSASQVGIAYLTPGNGTASALGRAERQSRRGCSCHRTSHLPQLPDGPVGAVMLTAATEQGFTLLEVIVALTLIVGGLLGLGVTTGSILQRSRAVEIEDLALQAVQDRLEIVRLHPGYVDLDSLFSGSEILTDDLADYTRTTMVERVIAPMPGNRVVDFTEISVEVSGPGLPAPVGRTAIVGAP